MSVLVTSEILGLFGKTLGADHMYYHHNWRKFRQHVKTPFSEKRKTLSWIFIAFLQSTQNFVHFEKKDPLHSLNIWEVIDSKKWGYLNVPKLLF